MFHKIIVDLKEEFEKTRWFGLKGYRNYEMKVMWYSIVDSDIVLCTTMFQADDQREFYYIPIGISDHPPQYYTFIKTVDLNKEQIYLFDGDSLGKYHNVVLSGIIEKYGPFEAKILAKIPVELFVENYVATSSTNVLYVLSSEGDVKFIAKSYRKMSANDIEPMILLHLTKRGFNHAPRLYGLLRYLGKPFPTTTWILEEYIGNTVEGGYPFYINLKNYISSRNSPDENLVSTLSETIAELHFNLSLGGSFFKPEPVSRRDITYWNERILRRTKRILSALSEMEPSISREYKTVFNHLLERYLREEVIEDIINYYQPTTGELKMRIHQDLHLSQTLYSPLKKKFYIIDFEGEPGRSDYERSLKEPAVRDVACVLRSFSYLTIFTAKELSGKSMAEMCMRFLEGNVRGFNEWLRMASKMLVDRYVGFLKKFAQPIICLDGNDVENIVQRSVTYWSLEKALYEVEYELKYRPEFTIVPATGIAMIIREYLMRE